MLSCEEVSRAIASDELDAAGWHKRLSVELHLLMCRHCRRYYRQMREIGASARRLLAESSQDRSSRERLRASILAHVPPGDDD